MDSHFSADGRRDLAIAGSALACLSAAFVIPQTAIEDGPVVCPFRLATGLPCPGCGLARSWVALAHGDVETAFARHAFGPLLFVLSVAAVVAVGHRLVRGRRPANLARLAGSRGGIALAVVWCAAWASMLFL
jgi:hypothetical protein